MRKLVYAAAILSLLAGSVSAQDRVFFGNLHSHTSLSDGQGTPEDAYTHARQQAGLDFLAVTEHNHRQAGDLAENPALYNGSDPSSLISTATRHTVDGKFVAIYGQEVSSISSGNHVNVFEVGDVVDTLNGAYDDFLNDWLPAHPDSTGRPAILLLNHPATRSSPSSREYGRDDFDSEEEWIRRLDASAALINVINGPSHEDGQGLRPGRPSESEFARYLNLGLHVAPTADQDNHRRNWGSSTHARTAVVAAELTKPALLTALRNRHVYATEDRSLRILCRVNGHLCGDVLTGSDVPDEGAELQIELRMADDDEPDALYEVHVFVDEIGGDPLDFDEPIEIVAHEGDGVLTIEDVTYAGGRRYVLFKVFQVAEDEASSARAWTAPTWFETDAGEGGDDVETCPSIDSVLINVRTEVVATATAISPASWSVATATRPAVEGLCTARATAFTAALWRVSGEVLECSYQIQGLGEACPGAPEAVSILRDLEACRPGSGFSQAGDPRICQADTPADCQVDCAPGGETGTTTTTDTAIASRRSEVFHVGLECLDAQRIKESNQRFGEEARSGRRLHHGCPRTR